MVVPRQVCELREKLGRRAHPNHGFYVLQRRLRPVVDDVRREQDGSPEGRSRRAAVSQHRGDEPDGVGRHVVPVILRVRLHSLRGATPTVQVQPELHEDHRAHDPDDAVDVLQMVGVVGPDELLHPR